MLLGYCKIWHRIEGTYQKSYTLKHIITTSTYKHVIKSKTVITACWSFFQVSILGKNNGPNISMPSRKVLKMLRRPLVVSKNIQWRPSKETRKCLDPGFLKVELESRNKRIKDNSTGARDTKLTQSYKDDTALFWALCFLKCPNFGSHYTGLHF